MIKRAAEGVYCTFNVPHLKCNFMAPSKPFTTAVWNMALPFLLLRISNFRNVVYSQRKNVGFYFNGEFFFPRNLMILYCDGVIVRCSHIGG